MISIGKDLIPIIVAIISAVLAYYFGRFGEKKKKYTVMAEESLNIHLSKMYREIIILQKISSGNVKKIKKFILTYSAQDSLYKLYDDELNYKFLHLLIKIKKNEITNDKLLKEFVILSNRIERLYWERLKVYSNDFKWWVNKQVITKWYSIPLNFLFMLKDVIEYFFIVFAMITLFCVADHFSNGNQGLTIPEFRGLIYALTILLLISYIFIFVSYNIFSDKREIKKYYLVKKK